MSSYFLLRFLCCVFARLARLAGMSVVTPCASGTRRTRKLSSYVRVFDQDTRDHIRLKNLEALEQDNAPDERSKQEDEDGDYMEDEDDAQVSVKKQKKVQKQRRSSFGVSQKCKSLQEVIDESAYYRYPSWVPTFSSIAAKPSRYPARRFCSITGNRGKYKCGVTGDYLASVSAYTTHRETRLKGLV